MQTRGFTATGSVTISSDSRRLKGHSEVGAGRSRSGVHHGSTCKESARAEFSGVPLRSTPGKIHPRFDLALTAQRKDADAWVGCAVGYGPSQTPLVATTR